MAVTRVWNASKRALVNVSTFYDGVYKGCWFAVAQLLAQLCRVHFVPSKKFAAAGTLNRVTASFNAELLSPRFRIGLQVLMKYLSAQSRTR